MEYYDSNPPPANLAQFEENINAFLKHIGTSSKLAIVTSGGTTVPLENNTVRFIDNFSVGSRGALSAETFLKQNYKVIFLYRSTSLRPFNAEFSDKPTLDWLQINSTTNKVEVKPEFEASFSINLNNRQNYIENNYLLELPFTTVNEYLYFLKSVAEHTSFLNERVLFYLAAAVSDFYLPSNKISEHKIQSRGMDKLVIDLDPVPKVLKVLVSKWSTRSVVVTFKLETDANILISKCQSALSNYHHQAVVGNLLQTRKNEVIIITNKTQSKITRTHKNIEEDFVPVIIALHSEYVHT